MSQVGQLIQKARAYAEKNQIKKALSSYQDAFEAAQNSHDLDSKRIIYYEAADIHESTGGFKKAQELYKAAYSIAIKQPNTDLFQAGILLRLGNASREQAQWNQALHFYNAACKLFKKLKDWESLIQGILEKGITFETAGHFDEAINHYNRALELSMNLDEDILGGECLLLLGSVSKKMRCYKKALRYYEKAQTTFDSIYDDEKLITCLLEMGRVYSLTKGYENALDKYEKGLRMAVRWDNHLAEGAFLMEIGNIVRDRKEYDRALRIYAEAMEIENSLNVPLRLALLTMNMGIAYHAKNQLEAARICYSRASSKLREKAYHQEIALHLAECQFHHGKICIRQNDPQTAIECYQDVLRVWNSEQRPSQVAIAMFNLGNAYMQLGDRKNAEYFVKKSLGAFIELKSPYAEVARRVLDAL